ncbi:MAG TPA: 2Fe-2S iron-sulfur cluster-binding protein, partial [Candidatus Binatus sp.]|nr:2Fe-2S iron-sulfur cluster-binding protein [Candidatus Binatus sp.]
MKSALAPARAVENRTLRSAFTARLKEVAARPDVVPIVLDGRRLEVRRGGTILGAAMKNGVRLMHVCGARTLCATCRVVVDAGE